MTNQPKKEKCDCGLVEDGSVFICPLHYKRLLEDSSINSFVKEKRLANED